MKKMAICLLVCFLSVSVFAQNMVLNDPVSSRQFNSDKYSGYRGSPFLYDKWMTGSAWISKGYYSQIELKFDVYTNTLYFNRNDELFEFQDNVTGFTLMPDVLDSSSYMYFKKGVSGAGLKSDQFVQKLFEGKLSLYRSELKLLSDMNEINVGVVKTFTTTTRYFLLKDDNLQIIKLNKKEVFEIIGDKEAKINAYITEKKLSTKKEADLIAVLKYYNTL